MKIKEKQHNIISISARTYDLTGNIDNRVLEKHVLANEHKKLSKSLASTSYEDSELPMIPELKKLFKIIDSTVTNIDSRIEKYMDKQDGAAGSMPRGGWWGHVCDPKTSTMLHNHRGENSTSVISWCYYVKTEKNSGDLVFAINMPHSVQDFYVEIEPKESGLIVFPGWMSHFTKQNHSNAKRISIAGNYYLDSYDIKFLKENTANEKTRDFLGSSAANIPAMKINF